MLDGIMTTQIAIATGNATAIANNVIISPAANQKVRCYKIYLSNNHNAGNLVSLHWEGAAASVTLTLPTSGNAAPVEVALPTGGHFDGLVGLDLQIDVASGTVDWVLMYHLLDA